MSYGLHGELPYHEETKRVPKTAKERAGERVTKITPMVTDEATITRMEEKVRRACPDAQVLMVCDYENDIRPHLLVWWPKG